MASTVVAPPDHSAQVTHGINPCLIAASVMPATFMEVLDTAISPVFLPYIAGSFSASTGKAPRVFSSYPAATAKVPLFDRYGFAALVIWTGCLQVVLDKGQEDDWFGAIWIRWAVFFLITSFVYFIWHSWKDKDTLVDLKVLKNRNFALGCILIF